MHTKLVLCPHPKPALLALCRLCLWVRRSLRKWSVVTLPAAEGGAEEGAAGGAWADVR